MDPEAEKGNYFSQKMTEVKLQEENLTEKEPISNFRADIHYLVGFHLAIMDPLQQG